MVEHDSVLGVKSIDIPYTRGEHYLGGITCRLKCGPILPDPSATLAKSIWKMPLSRLASPSK